MRSAPTTLLAIIVAAAGAAAALLVLEILLRCLPVGGINVYAADPAADWPVHHLVSNVDYVHSTGWNLQNVHRGHVNDVGYAAPFDYRGVSGGVAVFGDSYVESLMNDYAETVQGRLPRLLTAKQPVLQFGMSGSSLPDYLGVSALVAQRYRPDWAVLVLTKGDFTEGFQADDGHYAWLTDSPSLIRLQPVLRRGALQKWVRGLALFRYQRYNLKVSLAGLLTPARAVTGATPTACNPERLEPGDEAVLQRYVELLPLNLRMSAGHIVLVFDSNRAELYKGGSAALDAGCVSRESLALARLRELAAARGFNVIDTAPIFTRFHRATNRLLDHGPLDRHWNADAHRLVAEAVANIINLSAASAHAPASRDY